MKHIMAILEKQLKDTFKNKTVLIQFVMFPALTIIMENAVKMEGMPEHFFTNLFAVMYIGMAPLTAMSAIISEEKEKNTLRALLRADVKPGEYLTGVGIYIFAICMFGTTVIGVGGGYREEDLGRFLGIVALGILVSMFMGAAIGTFSKNQMAATSITVPVMMVFSFLPMLAMFNKTMEKIARFAYSQQISEWINQPAGAEFQWEQPMVILVNMLVALLLFAYAYHKKGLE